MSIESKPLDTNVIFRGVPQTLARQEQPERSEVDPECEARIAADIEAYLAEIKPWGRAFKEMVQKTRRV